MKAIKYLTCIFIFLPLQILHPQNISWEKTEGPYGGYITALHQSSTGKIYAGGRGILFMRNSNQNQWTVAVRTNTNSQATTIVENSFGVVFASFGIGTYKSSDDGLNWELIDSGIPEVEINKLTIDDQDNLYTTDLIYPTRKIFKSTDNGITWNEIYSYSSTAHDFYVIQSGENGLIIAGGYGPIYLIRSVDYGQTWNQINFTNLNGIYNLNIVRNDLIYATEYSNDIWKSTDNGISWYLVSLAPTNQQISFIENDSSYNIYLGLIDIDRVYNGGLYKSTDGGLNWSQNLIYDLKNKQVSSFEIINNEKIWIGTFGKGVLELSTIDSTWIEMNTNMSDFVVNSIAINSENSIWIGTSRSGIHNSKNGSSDWKEYSDSLQGLSAYEMKFSTRDELFLAITDGLFKFNDIDSNWINVRNPSWGRGTRIEIKDYDTLLVGTWDDGIPVSYDNGQNWFFRYVYSRYVRVSSIKMLSNRKIIVGGEGAAYVFISSDNFLTWSYLDYLGSFSVADLEQAADGSLLVGLRSNYWSGLEGRLYISSDEGQNWENIIDSIGNPYIYCIKPHTNDRIFIGTAEGIYLTTDYGNNWQQLNDGLDNLYVRSLAIDNYGYIYAGTEEGVYRSTSNIITNIEYQETAETFYLTQNYPNPFNPNTKIKFTIPSIGTHDRVSVQIKVYDVLGNEITTLVNEKKPAGTYDVEFDGIGLPSGIYFYQLKADSFVETKKMVLMK